ncbi:hypothetical protein KGMB01110_04790 [Mediterraneibacter butyricigenes]|uniref:Phage protein n=1 Tax=Mediterraneibacter butyricigenes TaxID=2316025 RepID=A0A391P8Y2_9FIRM|nr:hypothetical protein [Mediterraneibacter butyricigenes]GCA66043.1 hypothetical protein KGMB01110_04790 [Mediterraneibacter butyricigenes]
MWKLKAKQTYMSEYDYERVEDVIFEAEDLAEINDIVDMFKKYSIGTVEFFISQVQEEKEA